MPRGAASPRRVGSGQPSAFAFGRRAAAGDNAVSSSFFGADLAVRRGPPTRCCRRTRCGEPLRDAKARPNYAGTSPITKASGTSRVVVARLKRNRRLIDACWQWAFCALTASPRARVFYDAHNTGPTHCGPLDASC